VLTEFEILLAPILLFLRIVMSLWQNEIGRIELLIKIESL